MDIKLDGIPQAVAAIVGSCYSGALSKAEGMAAKDRDDLENQIVKFTERLTKTLLKTFEDAKPKRPPPGFGG